MRIVGGRLRGRSLAAPEGLAVRPTADRTREALFNILTQGRLAEEGPALEGARLLDAFAGTGALGLEALSRGAARAFFLETDPAAQRALRRNIEALDQNDRAEVLTRDATHPGRASIPCNLALLDPPYGADLAVPALVALASEGWFVPDAIAVVEHGFKEKPASPDGFEALDERRYGAATFTVFQFRPIR